MTVFMIKNIDDMLSPTLTTHKSLSTPEFGKKLNDSFGATLRSNIHYYLGMRMLYDKQRGIFTVDAQHHVYCFILHVGLGISTPLNPHEIYSKTDSPSEINVQLRDKAWQAHGKLIHLAILARTDLVHSASVLGRSYQNLKGLQPSNADEAARFSSKEPTTIYQHYIHPTSQSLGTSMRETLV